MEGNYTFLSITVPQELLPGEKLNYKYRLFHIKYPGFNGRCFYFDHHGNYLIFSIKDYLDNPKYQNFCKLE